MAGRIAIETSFTGETVSEVDPLTDPSEAAMVVLPLAMLVTSPWLLTVAAAGVEELQTAEPVTSCVLESLNVPVAVICLVVPDGMVEFAGVTAKETRVAPVTVTEALPLTEPEVAVTVVLPVPTAVATPLAAFTEATAALPEDQVTEGSNWVLPSSKLPVAANCCAVPLASETGEGLTAIEIR